jgi:hypothetical protein
MRHFLPEKDMGIRQAFGIKEEQTVAWNFTVESED